MVLRQGTQVHPSEMRQYGSWCNCLSRLAVWHDAWYGSVGRASSASLTSRCLCFYFVQATMCWWQPTHLLGRLLLPSTLLPWAYGEQGSAGGRAVLVHRQTYTVHQHQGPAAAEMGCSIMACLPCAPQCYPL